MREIVACSAVADLGVALFCYHFVVTFAVCPFDVLVKINGNTAVNLFDVIGAWLDYVLGVSGRWGSWGLHIR